MTLKEQVSKLIKTIKEADPAEVKKAQKELEKLWHKAPRNSKRLREAFSIFTDELKDFDQIKDLNHQYYFVNSLKFVLWRIGRDNFEVFKDFLLNLVQHKSGKLRQSAVKAMGWLHMSIDFDVYSYKRTKVADHKKEIAKNRLKFCHLVDEMNVLLDKYHSPEFDKYQYIGDLPVSIYKSIELMMAELIRSPYYQGLYQIYLNTDPAMHMEVLAEWDFDFDYELKEPITKERRIRADKILPQIQLKYFGIPSGVSKPVQFPDAVCYVCNRKNLPTGGMRDAYSDNPKFICEDCAIDQYQKHYKFKTREAAEAHRRRMFDVNYLWTEMLIDEYLKHEDLISIEDLSEREHAALLEYSRISYDELFSREQKKDLDVIEDQEEIEQELKKRLRWVDLKKVFEEIL